MKRTHDLELLINKRLSSGAYNTIEDVLRDALEAERGDLIDNGGAERQVQDMKSRWREERLQAG